MERMDEMDSPVSVEEYLTVDELSERIKMAPGSVRNLIWKKVFRLNVHYVKPLPKKILFVWSEVEKWLYGENSGAAISNPSQAGGKRLVAINSRINAGPSKVVASPSAQQRRQTISKSPCSGNPRKSGTCRINI